MTIKEAQPRTESVMETIMLPDHKSVLSVKKDTPIANVLQLFTTKEIVSEDDITPLLINNETGNPRKTKNFRNMLSKILNQARTLVEPFDYEIKSLTSAYEVAKGKKALYSLGKIDLENLPTIMDIASADEDTIKRFKVKAVNVVLTHFATEALGSNLKYPNLSNDAYKILENSLPTRYRLHGLENLEDFLIKTIIEYSSQWINREDTRGTPEIEVSGIKSWIELKKKGYDIPRLIKEFKEYLHPPTSSPVTIFQEDPGRSL